MLATLTLLLALSAPVQDGPVQQPAGPIVEEAIEATHPGEEHAEGEFDILHHILDANYIETPFGDIDLPADGSWVVAGIDMTPTKHVVFLWVAALLTLIVLIGGGQMAKRHRAGGRMRRRHNAVEALVLFFRDTVVMPNVGHGGERYVPFITTLFFFILFGNLLGLLPWGATATANIAVTAGLALISLVVVEAAGMRALGPKGYLGTIVYIPQGLPKPLIPVMAIIMTPVELLGKVAKPFALAIRLMANMTAGHIVLLALLSLIFVFGSYWIIPAPIVMSVAIFFLEIFVAFLQAFIFALLTAVFIGLITAH